MSKEAFKLSSEFNRYFTSINGIDVPERVSVPRDEWRALFKELAKQLGHANRMGASMSMKRINRDDTEHGVDYYRASEVDALLAGQAAPVPAQQPPKMFDLTSPPAPWHHRILITHPKSEPEHWPNELRLKYMEAELAEYRDVRKEQLDRYMATGDINPQPAPAAQQEPVPTECRRDGRCQYVIDLGLEGQSLGFPLLKPTQLEGPTKAMIDAAERIDWSDSDVRGNIVNMWQAMCSVAPQVQPAQPAQQPLTRAELRQMYQNATGWQFYCDVDARLFGTADQKPAPVQQPVAWLHEWEDGERIPLMYPKDDRNDDTPKSVRPLVFGDTSPPAQQPLTDEQVKNLKAETGYDWFYDIQERK